MDNLNLLTLKVGGQLYAGWKSVNIRLGLEQIAGTYELSVTERWPSQPTEWSIPPGELCEILIGDETVISGYVDAVAVNYDANSHEIRVTGRDRTGDLVDCSAPSTAFSGLTFVQIAEKLTAPYGIALYDETVAGRKLTTKQKKAGKKGTSIKSARVGSARMSSVPIDARSLRPRATRSRHQGSTNDKAEAKHPAQALAARDRDPPQPRLAPAAAGTPRAL